MHRLPPYAWIGLGVLLASETLMLRRIEPFWSWHTPMAWSGFILFADGIVRARRGSSWLTSHPREFLFLALVSIPLWLVFEFYNLFIRNWHYVNLPENAALRLLGYGWSFATIWPAIFETAELVGVVRDRRGPSRAESPVSRQAGTTGSARRISTAGAAAMAAGAAMMIWPLVWPSPYLAAPVWLGLILLLDPLNARAGGEALTVDFQAGRYDRAVNLMIAGVIDGLLWEFWNYWSRAKWIYDVPILPELKIFEMPLAGYFGFPAFALECFTMYVAVRLILWRGPIRPIAL